MTFITSTLVYILQLARKMYVLRYVLNASMFALSTEEYSTSIPFVSCMHNGCSYLDILLR